MPKIKSPSDIFKEHTVKASQKIYDELREYWLGILDEKACFEIVAESMGVFLTTWKIGSYLLCRQFAKHGVRCNLNMSRKIFNEVFFEPMKQMIYGTRIGTFRIIDNYDHISIELTEMDVR